MKSRVRILKPWARQSAPAPASELQEYWRPGFETEKELNRTKGPFVEVAGPTPDGYEFIDSTRLNKRIYITNILGWGALAAHWPRQANAQLDALVDMKCMPFRDDSVGAIFGSGLMIGQLPAYGDSFFQETHRSLEPGGLAVIQNVSGVHIGTAENAGFDTAAVKASYFNHNGPDSWYVYSAIFVKPA